MIVGLGGGIGATRLWRGFARVADPLDQAFIVNTADDVTQWGLRICPDVDATIYGLADVLDEAQGWGLRDESWRCREQLTALGWDTWFGLGDTDLATHMVRTSLRREGMPLTGITSRLARARGVVQTILPMCDGDVETWILADDGREMHYQEYLVRHRCEPQLAGFARRGIDGATASPEVLEALARASLIVIGPSNPIASIGSILAVAGIRDAIRASNAPKVAVTPTVMGVPIEHPGEANRALSRRKLLEYAQIGFRPAEIGRSYAGLADAFVLDRIDRDERSEIERGGLEVIEANTLIPAADEAAVLAGTIITWGRQAEAR